MTKITCDFGILRAEQLDEICTGVALERVAGQFEETGIIAESLADPSNAVPWCLPWGISTFGIV